MKNVTYQRDKDLQAQCFTSVTPVERVVSEQQRKDWHLFQNYSNGERDGLAPEKISSGERPTTATTTSAHDQ
jgi:hypothetical protein